MSPILNKRGFLTIESAMVIPIILCVIMVLTILQYKVSDGGAVSVIDDRKDLKDLLTTPPKVELFYKVHLANGFSEIMNKQEKGDNDGQVDK